MMPKYIRNTLVALGILGVVSAQVIDRPVREKDYKQNDGILIIQKKYEFDGIEMIGGTVRNENEMRVKGNFILRKEAIFENKGVLIFEPNATINIEKKDRIITIPASYGPRYSSTGVVLFSTGSVVTATGSRIELYTPSIGYVIIE